MVKRSRHGNGGTCRSYVQGALACWLMFLAGSTFALGVFTPDVEDFAQPPHVLDGVWEIAMGFMHFLSAPIMIITGIYLDAGHQQQFGAEEVLSLHSKTFRTRLLSLISLLAFACLAVAAHGASYSNPITVFLGVAMQSFPLAVVYLLCTELLMVWYPRRSALAVACGQTAFGMGTIVITWVFSELISRTGHVNAILIGSGMLTVAAVPPTMSMRWPTDGEASVAEEEQPLQPHMEEVEKISWRRLIGLSNFWLYMVVVFTASTGYMFNPYFFKLGKLFHRPMDELVLVFNATNMASAVCGLFCTALIDLMGFGSGFWFSGAKNMMMVFMLFQGLLMLSMIVANDTMNFQAFVVVKVLVKLIMTCHVGCSAILTRDLFGSRNMVVVFGFGAGLALGCGEATSAWVMATVESLVGNVSRPSDYNLFYWIAGIWNFVGLVCAILVRRHKTKTFSSVLV